MAAVKVGAPGWSLSRPIQVGARSRPLPARTDEEKEEVSKAS